MYKISFIFYNFRWSRSGDELFICDGYIGEETFRKVTLIYCIHLILALELNFLATMSFFGLDDNMMLKNLRVLCILIIFLPTLHSPEVVIQYPQICTIFTSVQWCKMVLPVMQRDNVSIVQWLVFCIVCKVAMYVLFNNLLSKRPSYSDPMAVTHCTLRWCYIHTSFIILVQIYNLFSCNRCICPP